jgi:hypothetical protein
MHTYLLPHVLQGLLPLVLDLHGGQRGVVLVAHPEVLGRYGR